MVIVIDETAAVITMRRVDWRHSSRAESIRGSLTKLLILLTNTITTGVIKCLLMIKQESFGQETMTDWFELIDCHSLLPWLVLSCEMASILHLILLSITFWTFKSFWLKMCCFFFRISFSGSKVISFVLTFNFVHCLPLMLALSFALEFQFLVLNVMTISALDFLLDKKERLNYI